MKPHTIVPTTAKSLVAIAAALSLAACGGGGGGSTDQNLSATPTCTTSNTLMNPGIYYGLLDSTAIAYVDENGRFATLAAGGNTSDVKTMSNLSYDCNNKISGGIEIFSGGSPRFFPLINDHHNGYLNISSGNVLSQTELNEYTINDGLNGQAFKVLADDNSGYYFMHFDTTKSSPTTVNDIAGTHSDYSESGVFYSWTTTIDITTNGVIAGKSKGADVCNFTGTISKNTNADGLFNASLTFNSCQSVDNQQDFTVIPYQTLGHSPQFTQLIFINKNLFSDPTPTMVNGPMYLKVKANNYPSNKCVGYNTFDYCL